MKSIITYLTEIFGELGEKNCKNILQEKLIINKNIKPIIPPKSEETPKKRRSSSSGGCGSSSRSYGCGSPGGYRRSSYNYGCGSSESSRSGC